MLRRGAVDQELIWLGSEDGLPDPPGPEPLCGASTALRPAQRDRSQDATLCGGHTPVADTGQTPAADCPDPRAEDLGEAAHPSSLTEPSGAGAAVGLAPGTGVVSWSRQPPLLELPLQPGAAVSPVPAESRLTEALLVGGPGQGLVLPGAWGRWDAKPQRDVLCSRTLGKAKRQGDQM